MKFLVVSDIHGSYYYAKKFKEIYEKENPDQIILLGDLYYHGPRNALTEEYNPSEVAKILNKYAENKYQPIVPIIALKKNKYILPYVHILGLT